MATGLEIIGGISAVLAILQTTIDVANRIKSAADKKRISIVVKQNQKEVTSLKDMVAIVKDEQALQTKSIIIEIGEIGELAIKLEDLLRTIDDAGFISRFVHGKDQKEELSSLTGDVAKAKLNLIIKIQSAHVGLTVSGDQKFMVQMEKIESMDRNLKQLINGFEGLSIGEVVKGREPGSEGMVTLDESDLEQLGLETGDDGPYQDGSRIIDNNIAYDQALMINGTIGTEGFIEPKHVRIYNNIARHQATMINASISRETWKDTREDRLEIIKAMAAQGTLGQGQGQLDEVLKKDLDKKSIDRVREGRVERSQGEQIGELAKS